MSKQIRVLHILYSMNRGGAETMVMNYYRHIDKKTVQFDFLISAPEKCAYEDEILSLGGRIFRVPILSKTPLGYIKEVNLFFKKNKEYTIVHAHTSAKNTLPLAIARWNEVPVRISHSHNTRSEKGLIGVVKSVFKPFLKFVTTDFLTCSEEAGCWLYGADFYKKNGVLFPNVIDSSKCKFNSEIRSRLRAQNNWETSFVIGNVARFNHQKNHEFIIDIFNMVHQKMPSALLLLIGDGPLRKNIEMKVSKLKLKEFVIFKGAIDNVHDYLQAMDTFILPSHYEGLPLTVVEAQAAGLKSFLSEGVITEESNLTGLVEFISLQESPVIWAEKILSSIDNPRNDLSQLIINSGYDASTSAKYLQDFYLKKSYIR